MNRAQKGIKAAINAAHFTNYSRYRVGAAIYIGNRLISIGWNQRKTHPKQRSIFRWTHAEMSAIIGTNKHDLTRSTIYVARITPGGDVKMAKPCIDCQRILRAAGIKNIIFTDEQGRTRKL